MTKTSIITAFLTALFLCLTAHHATAVPAGDKDKFDIENAGALTGRVVTEDGTPFPYGFVAFFADDGQSGEHQDYGISKRAPLMVAFIKKDGRFTTQLFPAGTYFMGAIMEKKWVGGAPRQGQKKYSAFDDTGKYLLLTVQPAKTTDVGTVTVREPVNFPARKQHFTISGKVLDSKGRGIADSVVVVKKNINAPKGIFISAETDQDGSYELKIPPGKYFFVARKSLTRAGRPKPGTLMGFLGQTKPVGIGGKSEEPPAYINGKDGATYTDVDITMFKLPIPDVKRKEIEARVKAKEINKSNLPADLPLMKQQTDTTVPSQHQPK